MILRGNLAPSGAVMKPIAAEPRLLRHAGRALVFDSYEQMSARIDDPALPVDADSVLVLRNAGPAVGQDSFEVMTRILGYADDEVAELAAAGVLS